MKKFELDVGKHYDRVMFVARKEGNLFDEMLGEKKSLIVPLGVDYPFFSQNLNLKKKEKSIAFMGALNVAHNENGITHFIEHCFPAIRSRYPALSCLLLVVEPLISLNNMRLMMSFSWDVFLMCELRWENVKCLFVHCSLEVE